MHTSIRRFIYSLLCLGLLATLSAVAGTANKETTDTNLETRDQLIADVVNDQLDAFSKDDGERAFSHASPTIKAHFKTPETFMRMVKTGYSMVYRPKSFTLEKVREASGVLYQPVLFTDQQGQLYKVLYKMQQQTDMSWKINGVQVLRPKGLAV